MAWTYWNGKALCWRLRVRVSSSSRSERLSWKAKENEWSPNFSCVRGSSCRWLFTLHRAQLEVWTDISRSTNTLTQVKPASDRPIRLNWTQFNSNGSWVELSRIVRVVRASLELWTLLRLKKLKSTKNRPVFASRRVLNIFGLSTTELSRIGRSELANRTYPTSWVELSWVVRVFIAPDPTQPNRLGWIRCISRYNMTSVRCSTGNKWTSEGGWYDHQIKSNQIYSP